jgi:hypothetical protein
MKTEASLRKFKTNRKVVAIVNILSKLRIAAYKIKFIFEIFMFLQKHTKQRYHDNTGVPATAVERQVSLNHPEVRIITSDPNLQPHLSPFSEFCLKRLLRVYRNAAHN